MKKHVSDRQRCTVKDRVAAYEYDGQNRRVVKEVYSGGSLDHTLDMYYNESWQILEVRKDGDADPLKQYVWHTFYIDAPAIRYYDADTDGAGVETQYFTHDANMNVTALIDDEGDVIERYDYTPYGQVTILNPNFSDDADGVSDYEQDVLFAGYQCDAESGMYHVRHRNYHPVLGRWGQRDPAGYSEGLSVYQYARSNALMRADATGLESKSVDLNRLCKRGGCDPESIASGTDLALTVRLETLSSLSDVCASLDIVETKNVAVNLDITSVVFAIPCTKQHKAALRKEIGALEDALKASTGPLEIGCDEDEKCCNKGAFNGTYSVSVEVSLMPIGPGGGAGPCKVSGSITFDIKVKGALGMCKKVQ